MAKATYQQAGVDLDVYRQSMARLPGLLQRTFSPRVIRNEGGFAGLFQLDFDSPLFARRYQDPTLVACCDGVGTKIKLAIAAEKHDTVGIDLVAMSVNDAICLGAEPLFFLDYVAMSRDDPDLTEQLVRGISQGCLLCDCALLGGETAIMPDMYAPGDYDLAGFCIGVVERQRIIDGKAISPGDAVIGVASSGLHSNGYSLARKIVQEAGLSPHDQVPPCGASVVELLLEPTRIYARPVRSILARYKKKTVVHGIAHITGGGLEENVGRILPPGTRLQLEPGSWPIPPVFSWLQQLGEVEPDEMRRVFNMGIGLVLIVSPYFAESIGSQLTEHKLESWIIGRIAGSA